MKLRQLFKSKLFNKKYLNKFTITSIVFLVWIMFFDKYNFKTHNKLSNSLTILKQEHKQVQSDIVKAKKQLNQLETHKEKYARERYYMHKPNEEIIVINQ